MKTLEMRDGWWVPCAIVFINVIIAIVINCSRT